LCNIRIIFINLNLTAFLKPGYGFIFIGWKAHFFGKFTFYEKSYPSSSSPFLFIKYSKTTYQKHTLKTYINIHVNIQNMKKMGHIFNKKQIWSLNRGTLIRFFMKNTLKCNRNNNFFHNFQRFAIFEI
jgi:hypothetical protein